MTNKDVEKHIDTIIDNLLLNAEALVKASRHDVSEEVLKPLQDTQEKLLSQLKEAESSLNGYYEMSERLKQFVELNTEYIENLSKAYGIIDFHYSNNNNINNLTKESNK